MKKVLSIIIAFALIFSMSAIVFADRSSEMGIDMNLSDFRCGTLLKDTDAVKQSDRDDEFQHYAEKQSTVVLDDSGQVNVVGIVRDYKNQSLISGAKIFMDEMLLVMTGSNGRFQIKNVPSGNHVWRIEAEGYYPSKYLNYELDEVGGANIFTFEASKEFPVVKDSKIIRKFSETSHDEFTESINQITTMSSVPSVQSTVSVYYNGSIVNVGREEYIYTVLSSELYAPSYYSNKGLNQTQRWQLYCAQAIAANTFLEYSVSSYSMHSSYDVCSTTHCQVYDPTKVFQEAIDATADIFYTISGSPATVVLFYEPYSGSYDYFWCAFFSSCDNQGTLTHGSSAPPLQAVSCSDLATGAGGHRKGLCQMGAAKRAKNGYNANQILMYYYANCGTEFCILY